MNGFDAEGSSLTLGPPAEQCNDDPTTTQWYHNAFWVMVGDILPDDQDDEPYWMTQDAAMQLASNCLN